MSNTKGNLFKYLIGILGLLICLTGVITVTACTGREDNNNTDKIETIGIESKNDGLIVVGVSQIGSESVWRTANTEDIQGILTEDNGYFLIFDNARQKQENQIKAIRKFISLQVDYIVFSPISEDGWDTVLMEAKEVGIPVILMDRQLNSNTDPELYTTWVGSDFKQEGIDAGIWLQNELEATGRQDEEINIVVLKGTEGSTSELGRTTGFEKIADEHPNWHILEQVDAEYTTAKGKEEMKRMLGLYPDIDVLVSQNDDMTFGALEALNEAGISTGVDGDMIIISFDATRTALEMVRDGIINVDVECNPLLGENISQIINMLENGETLKKKYYITETVFTQDNVDEALDSRTY